MITAMWGAIIIIILVVKEFAGFVIKKSGPGGVYKAN
jgi:hypothetical protein